jgi:hypothetical protein
MSDGQTFLGLARGRGHCFEKKSIWIAVEATKSGFDLSSILASKGLEDDC